jgi:hypothetical protein
LRARTPTIHESTGTRLPRSPRYDVLKCGRSPAGTDQLGLWRSSASIREASSRMKLIALTSLLLMLALIAVGSALSRKQTTAIPGVGDYRYADPIRLTEGGQMVARACGNCHSNQTNLPWYGHVVPISWWINRHVRQGREELNFSEWTRYTALERHNELESICGVVSNGRMPPASYKVLHPESRLAAEDKKLICAWADKERELEK